MMFQNSRKILEHPFLINLCDMIFAPSPRGWMYVDSHTYMQRILTPSGISDGAFFRLFLFSSTSRWDDMKSHTCTHLGIRIATFLHSLTGAQVSFFVYRFLLFGRFLHQLHNFCHHFLFLRFQDTLFSTKNDIFLKKDLLFGKIYRMI